MTYDRDLFPPLESRYDKPPFGGPDVLDSDVPRLKAQLDRVREVMRDGAWHSLLEIAFKCECTTQSASARLRDLRKPKFGGWTILRRRISEGTFLYARQDEGGS